MNLRHRRMMTAAEAAIRPMAEPLECRRLLSAVSWTGATGSGDWFTPGNWSTNTVPGPDDDVTIDVPGRERIPIFGNVFPPFSTASAAVRSLTTAEDISIGAAGLSVANGMTLLDNATITVATITGYLRVEFTSSLHVGGALSGQGRVMIYGDSFYPSYFNASGPLIIGPGVTVGGSGGGIVGQIVNEGLITGGGSDRYGNPQSFTIGGELTNNGTIQPIGDILLSPSGFNPGTGKLVAQSPGSTITFSGSFTQASLGTLIGSLGAPHFIIGYGANLTGGLALDATTGSWALNGGMMTRGIYRATGGASLQLRGGGAIDGVSLASDVIVNRGTTLSVTHDLELIDDARIHLSGGTLQFNGGHQQLVGNGEVLFEDGNGITAAINVVPNSSEAPTLSTESGVTIRTNGGNGVIGLDGSPASITSGGLTLASSGAITLLGDFINQGTLRVDTGGVIDLHTRYSGTGKFEVRGGSLMLSGSFSQADVGNFDRTGGQVVVTGTVAGGLNLNAATGSWDINGGVIVGGTYTAADSAMLHVIGPNGARLDNLTLAADLSVDSGTLTIANGVTFTKNARILLAASLNFGSGATLAGHGEIVFTGGAPRILGASGATLTIGPSVTIRAQGGNAVLDAAGNFVNQGLVVVEAAGAALDIAGRFTNSGVVRVSNGALKLENPLAGSGALDVQGGTLTLGGDFTQAGLGAFTRTGGVVNIIGTLRGDLRLTAATGSFNLAGGTLGFGGAYRATGGASLHVISDSTFNAFNVFGPLSIEHCTVAVVNNMAVGYDGGLVHMLGGDGGPAALEFRDGNQTLVGGGVIQFEGGSNSMSTVRAVRYLSNEPASVYVDEVKLRAVGGNGTIGGGGRLTSLVNRGEVSTSSAGGTITFKDTVDNRGFVYCGPGESMFVEGQFNNLFYVSVAAGATFTVKTGGTFDTSSGRLEFSIDGTPQSGRFGRIVSATPITLGGEASITLSDSFDPIPGDVYPLIQFPSATGSFSKVNGLVVDGFTIFTQDLSATAYTITATGQAGGPLAHVTDVFISSDAWTTGFLQSLASQGLGDSTFGYRTGAGDAALRNLPWTNLDRVSLRFDQPVNVQFTDLVLSGVRTATYPILSFNYDAATKTATWTFDVDFGADATLINLRAGTVTTTPGLRVLDGDYLDQLPSGEGAEGGDFRFRLNVLPADVNQSGGSIDAADLVLTRNRIGRSAANPGSGNAAYSLFNDLNGDGVINANDLVQVRNRVGTALPATPAFDYPNFSDTAGLAFFGDAAQVGDVLRLVPASEHHSGAVRRTAAQNLSLGFSTSFTFHYANVGGIVDDNGNQGTDGIAFTIQPPGSSTPVIAGAGVSVFFDAYRDGSDVSSSRVAVFLNGSQKAQFDVEALGVRYRDGGDHTAQIAYSNSTLMIHLDGQFVGLAKVNVGSVGLVGFAGFDGEAYADQELLNWSFRPTALTQPAAFTGKPAFASPPRTSATLEIVDAGRDDRDRVTA